MSNLFGSTRTVVRPRHALITPDAFVPAPLPGWSQAACVTLIAPAMGAGFSQTLVTLQEGGKGIGSTGETELFAYVLEGRCLAAIPGEKHTLAAGGYVFIPPAKHFEFSQPAPGTRLLLFQKRYQPSASEGEPAFLADRAEARPAQPFQGDPSARLQTLLPDSPEFDLAVNIFTYDPGAALPQVEAHVMEHGLLMLAGQGVYRLEDDWYPVRAGDVIWMAAYCPQWFVAMGKEPASYIYYKDVNRASLG